MTILNENDCFLFVIDIQEKLLNIVFNKQDLCKNAKILLKAAKALEIPTIVTEQYPTGLGNTVDEIAICMPDKTNFFEKCSFSAMDNPEIVETIKSLGKKQVVIFGIETHICVSQTVNSLIDAGYDVYVILDACGSRSDSAHKAGLDRIKEFGAHIITTEITLFEWLKSSKHPKFKEIQALIK